ncbi:secondary thiamine-phosphate synthase enzyme YjbQ [Legionella sp. PATHC038]|uniref:secondary thiamine-phosphate synthase enzyme YjbQ n=1 Tax=Legionella TaxID=445 RepID=UPI0022432C17|nr:secondary thiamine-phosphate synthase enzyme YjbQ [Legionella sp. PATHC038]MCW8398390.1 secondary thiamine-phosphate synthase enzyme YjbQ [Legionella sp. PATHC038]
MKIEQFALTFNTQGRGTEDITPEVTSFLSNMTIKHGLCHLFLKHTSASLIICENYDPQVRRDLENFLVRLVPDGDPLFKHVIEGKDDMPAHIRTVLTQSSLTIPIYDGKLALGTWQGIYLYEHRYQPQQRHLLITGVGD